MRTKNAKAITRMEAAHLARVKSCACVLCDAPAPSEAHHIRQGEHFTTVALCQGCHRMPEGVHGDQSMLRVRFRVGGRDGELAALNETLRRVAAVT